MAVLVVYGLLLLALSAAPAVLQGLGRGLGLDRREPVETLVARAVAAEGRREKARAVSALEARGEAAVDESLADLVEHRLLGGLRSLERGHGGFREG